MATSPKSFLKKTELISMNAVSLPGTFARTSWATRLWAGGPLVWFPDWHECQSGERTPPERGILLQRTLALKILLAPPHVSYRIGFCSTWTRPGQWRNLLQSFLFEARADLAAPPVCPLVPPQFVHSWTPSFSTVFLSFSQRICFPLLSVLFSAVCMSSHMQNWPYSIRLAMIKGPCPHIFKSSTKLLDVKRTTLQEMWRGRRMRGREVLLYSYGGGQ